MRERWQEALSVDRYFNPLLTIRHGQLALRSSLPERQMA
jgi:hypothetical protein